MKYNIHKNWLDSFELIKLRPVILLPFIVVAFLESLALELICFSTRFPLSSVASPIIRKFFGESFNHYPINFVILPKLFYYKQIGIYVVLGVFLSAICINIFKNTKEGLPLKANALIRNAASRYFSFLIYGVLMILLIVLLQRIDTFVFAKGMRFVSRYLTQLTPVIYLVSFTLVLFATNLIMQTFFVLTIPIVVLEKKSLLKALIKSVNLGFRKFFTIFYLIFLPFLVYLPVIFLKSISSQLIDKTFPEITVYVTAIGIIVSLFADCFMVVSTSQFVLDSDKK